MLSARSRKELATCHPDLQRLFKAVHDEFPIEVICGYRGKAAQDQAFAEKRSRVRFPGSPHNQVPSRAADVVPYPVDWNNIDAFKKLAVIVKATAEKLGIEVVYGGDWKRLVDRPHWELAED